MFPSAQILPLQTALGLHTLLKYIHKNSIVSRDFKGFYWKCRIPDNQISSNPLSWRSRLCSHGHKWSTIRMQWGKVLTQNVKILLPKSIYVKRAIVWGVTRTVVPCSWMRRRRNEQLMRNNPSPLIQSHWIILHHPGCDMHGNINHWGICLECNVWDILYCTHHGS